MNQSSFNSMLRDWWDLKYLTTAYQADQTVLVQAKFQDDTTAQFNLVSDALDWSPTEVLAVCDRTVPKARWMQRMMPLELRQAMQRYV
jgi:hypothetical protein